MSRRSFLDRIHRVLWAYFDERPGSIRRTQDALGVCENFLRTSRRRGSLSLRDLGRVLGVLGVPPSVFFGEVFPPEAGDEVARFGIEAEALARRDRPEALPEAVRVWPSNRPLYTREHAHLTALDRLRDEGAAGARQAVHESIEIVRNATSPELAAYALGIWGSSLRAVTDYETAQIVLWRGLSLANAHQLAVRKADLLQRASYVAALRSGDYRRGLALADRAIVEAAEAGDTHILGISLFARAYMLQHLGEHRAAIRCYRRGRSHLSHNEVRLRFGSLQAEAFAWHDLGDPEAADACIERALTDVPPGKDLSAKFLWFVARTAATRGKLNRSARLFRRVAAMLDDNPVDQALATVEWVRVLVRLGREDEARLVATATRRLVFPLSGNKLIAAAIADLVRVAASSEERLSYAFLEELIAKLAHGRGEPAPALPPT